MEKTENYRSIGKELKEECKEIFNTINKGSKEEKKALYEKIKNEFHKELNKRKVEIKVLLILYLIVTGAILCTTTKNKPTNDLNKHKNIELPDSVQIDKQHLLKNRGIKKSLLA